MKKRVDGYFLIINSGPSLRHVNGLHLFFLAIYFMATYLWGVCF